MASRIPPAMFFRAMARVGWRTSELVVVDPERGTRRRRGRRTAARDRSSCRRPRASIPRAASSALGPRVDADVPPRWIVRRRPETGEVRPLPGQVVVAQDCRAAPQAPRRPRRPPRGFNGSEQRFSTSTTSASERASSSSRAQLGDVFTIACMASPGTAGRPCRCRPRSLPQSRARPAPRPTWRPRPRRRRGHRGGTRRRRPCPGLSCARWHGSGIR